MNVKFKRVWDNPESRLVEPFCEHKLSAKVDGFEVGYIKISYIPSTSNFHKHITMYLRKKGMCIHPENTWYNLTDREFQSLIYVLSLEVMGWHEANDNAKKLVSMDRMASVALLYTGIMPEITKKHEKDYKEFCDYFVDKPFVSFIRVLSVLQNKGIGTSLYLEAAKWMEEMGMTFRLSDTASGTALHCHKKLEKMGKLSFDKLPLYGTLHEIKNIHA